MPLLVYNSLSGKKEPFTTLTPGLARMYVCGVTVYDHPHIGHARCYVAFDIIYRHLLARGYRVEYVRNFTDVDDKIIRRAAELKEDWRALTGRYIASYHQDMQALGLLPATVEPKATRHMAEITAAVAGLINKGHAYALDNGDVYFAVDSFKPYGQLSGRSPEDMLAGARVEVDERKRNPMDFALWKSAKANEPSWDSPWGQGRPGWHIECSAMSQKYLGETFDIHGGGKDLLFPHHENEKAQSEALNGRPFARFWLHNGFVRINQEKMSKSAGNFFTIKDILKIAPAEGVRLFLLSKHYRSPLDFSEGALLDAVSGLERLYTVLAGVAEAGEKIEGEPWGEENAVNDFEKAMDDDFNSAAAVGVLFALSSEINRLLRAGGRQNLARAKGGADLLTNLGGRLGLLRNEPVAFRQNGFVSHGKDIDPVQVESLIAQRHQARAEKNFARADMIRQQLARLGVVLEDSAKGTKWRAGGK
ncbi:MAG: cysteine--tRNA ligase [Desulfarculales bacterium]|jgi:cysteinyl-tRNA synthetase|nr:cysteine--tRNA ligase [Desulfarculales bacterium]